MAETDPPQAPRYRIRVRRHLDEGWAAHFDGLAMTAGFDDEGGPITILSGPVWDQAALHGFLNRIRDLGLELLAVERLEGRPGSDVPDLHQEEES